MFKINKSVLQFFSQRLQF